MNTGFAGAKIPLFTVACGMDPHPKVFRNAQRNALYGLKMGWHFFLISGKRGFAIPLTESENIRPSAVLSPVSGRFSLSARRTPTLFSSLLE